MEKIVSFKQLKIWQKGMEIVKDIYKLTKDFPREEVYGLTAQMRRASVSIPTNIAEGFKRYFPKEYKQFLHIALGSAAELETEILIAVDLYFASKARVNMLLDKIDHLSRMTTILIGKL